MQKSILFLGDHAKTAESAKEILGEEFSVSVVKTLNDALEVAGAQKFDLLIYDYDLKVGGGIEGLKKLRRIFPHLKILVISVHQDISLAVGVTKLGAKNFLAKPIERNRFGQAVSSIVSEEKKVVLDFESIEGALWLRGAGPRLKTLFGELAQIAQDERDVIVYGEPGIDKASIARVIHGAGAGRSRKFVSLDLLSFAKDASEAHFWSTVQELLEDRAGKKSDDELCGTLQLKGIEGLSDHFSLSILEFLKKKSVGELERIDRAIRVVLSMENQARLALLDAKGLLAGFAKLHLPTLRERIEDMPMLLDAYINLFSGVYNKKVRGVSTELLKFFSVYDWPGNYRELEILVRLSVLNSSGESICIRDLPLDMGALIRGRLRESTLFERTTLESLREGFERRLFKVVLENVGWDEARAARFLDIPQSVFHDRVNALGLSA